MNQVMQQCACGKGYWPSQRWIHKSCGVVNNPDTTVVNTDSRQVVWQKLNRDKYNAKMREYMRKRRAR